MISSSNTSFIYIGTSSDDPVDAVEDVIDDRDVDDARVIEDARDVTDVDAGIEEGVVDEDEDVADEVEVDKDVVDEDEVDKDVVDKDVVDEDEVDDDVVDELLFNVFRPSLFILTSSTDFKCMPTPTHMSTHLKKNAGIFLCLLVLSLLKIPMPL